MTTIHRLERKQFIVILGSVLLAGLSYFIPLPDRTTYSPPQPEQVQEPSLPVPTPEQQLATDSVPGQDLLVDSPTTSTSTAEGAHSMTNPFPPSESAAVKQPPVTSKQALTIPSTKETLISPVIEPLSSRDFHTGLLPSQRTQFLPITQGEHF